MITTNDNIVWVEFHMENPDLTKERRTPEMTASIKKATSANQPPKDYVSGVQKEQ